MPSLKLISQFCIEFLKSAYSLQNMKYSREQNRKQLLADEKGLYNLCWYLSGFIYIYTHTFIVGPTIEVEKLRFK